MPRRSREAFFVLIFKNITNICRSAIFVIIVTIIGYAILGPTAHAARTLDFPEGHKIREELFPAYSKWSDAMGRDWARLRDRDMDCARRLGKRCHLDSWAQFLGTLRQLNPRDQLHSINRFVNATTFIEDWDNWGVKDYWSAPGEFFAMGGDCEDYAISKYLSLRRLGFHPDDLRLVVLIDTRRHVAHAVLVVNLDGRRLVLDNLHDQILAWSEVRHYRPLYSLNEQAVWLHVEVKEVAQFSRTQR